MRKRSLWIDLIAVLAVVVVAAYSLGFGGGGSSLPAENETAQVEEDEGAGPAEPDDEFWLLSRAGGPGKLLDEAAVMRGRSQGKQLRAADAAEAAALPAAAPRQMRGNWSLVGPTNVGGRIVDLVVDINDVNTVYVAAASGGVWKTTDGAVEGAMEYAWNDEFPQGMGAITMGSDGRLWAGSGEVQPGGGSITFPGDGVYVSSDRGASWRNVGLRDSKTTGDIVVDPSNPNRIFVAAGGSLYLPGGERGIYRSDTGGANWKQVLAPETDTGGGVDIAIDPSNPTASSRRSGTTSASPRSARTGASAPASIDRTTAATRGPA